MISALNVTNNILKRAFREEKDISPMKLQKNSFILCTKNTIKGQAGFCLVSKLKHGNTDR